MNTLFILVLLIFNILYTYDFDPNEYNDYINALDEIENRNTLPYGKSTLVLLNILLKTYDGGLINEFDRDVLDLFKDKYLYRIQLMGKDK